MSGIGATEKIVSFLKTTTSFLSKTVYIPNYLEEVHFSSTVNGGGGGNVRSCLLSLYKNPTTVAGTSYNNLDVNYSTCQYSTAGSVATFGTKLKIVGSC